MKSHNLHKNKTITVALSTTHSLQQSSLGFFSQNENRAVSIWSPVTLPDFPSQSVLQMT